MLPVFFVFLSLKSFEITKSSSEFDYKCWSDAEQKVIYYQNAPNVTVDLPTVRITQGWWGSQFATHFLAKMYLEEKMGVKVSLHIFSLLSYFSWIAAFVLYVENSNSMNDFENKKCKVEIFPSEEEWSISTMIADKSLDYWADYPPYQFKWLYTPAHANDKMSNQSDMILEVWPGTISIDVKQAIQDERIIDGGFTGVYGEIDWFIPIYMWKSDQKYLLMQTMINDATYRSQVIAGARMYMLCTV